jgi:hypothetical protein
MEFLTNNLLRNEYNRKINEFLKESGEILWRFGHFYLLSHRFGEEVAK